MYITATQVATLPAQIGSGDSVQISNATIGQLLDLKAGTAASPNTISDPLLKIERTQQLSSADWTAGSDGAEPCAAIIGIGSGTTTNDGQVVGVFGGAKSSSTTVVSSGGDDACGIYGIGRITGSGTGAGIGGFFNGRRDTDTGKAVGLEISADNNTATAGTYSSSGVNTVTGIWLHATGTARGGVGLVISNPFDVQFDVGIAFNAQGTGGPILSTSIRDDSSSTTSIAINGTHTTALAVAAGAGYGVIGATARVSSSALFEVVGPASTTDPLVQFGSTNANAYSVRLRNSGNTSIWFAASGSNQFVTGSAGGDHGIAIADSPRKFLFGASAASPALAIQNNSGVSQLGFFGVTTATKQTVTGSRGGNAALASLLTGLAAYGLVTDSSTA